MRKVGARSLQRHFANENDSNEADRDAGTMGTRGAAAPLPFWEGAREAAVPFL